MDRKIKFPFLEKESASLQGEIGSFWKKRQAEETKVYPFSGQNAKSDLTSEKKMVYLYNHWVVI